MIDLMTGIVSLIICLLLTGVIIFSYYVDGRKLKAVKQLEKQAKFINDLLDGDRIRK